MSDIGPGDLVMCVAGPSRAHTPEEVATRRREPKPGMFYTVRDTHVDVIGDPGILLNEIVNKETGLYRREVGFHTYRFRKIENRDESQTVSRELETVTR